MKTAERRYDIDWIRVIAIGLLLIYHISIVFQPWGIFIGFIQSADPLEGLWKPMSMLNVWRIPLLFYISGMGLAFASRKRSLKDLFRERSRRILIPFIFGMLAIVPWHAMLWQSYYNQEMKYMVHPSHLWFLGNIFIYVLLLTPLLKWMSKNEKVVRSLEKLYAHPLGMVAVFPLFIAESILLKPESYQTFALSWYGFFVGILAFFFGYTFILGKATIWQNLKRWKWVYLTGAFGLYLYRLIYLQLVASDPMMSIESNLWIFGVLGLGYNYLNRPGKTLSYLSQAAYPVYILHMFFLFLGAFIFLPMALSTIVKLLAIIVFTFAGSMGVYEFLVRRIRVLRVLFGLKSIRQHPVPEITECHFPIPDGTQTDPQTHETAQYIVVKSRYFK